MRAIPAFLLAGLVLSAAQPRSAQATEGDLFDLSLEELARIEVISSAAKQEQLLQDAPGAATIVTREEIEAFGYRTLADLLAAERGFATVYDRNYTYPGLRGFSRPTNNKRILVLIDGNRVNENYYEQAFLGTAFPVDLDLVQRVEIVRGPNSALYGTNAMAAVVNVITRKPGAGPAVEIAALGGSQATGHVTGAYSGGDGGAGGRWLVAGSWYRSDGVDRLYYPEYDDSATNDGFYLDNDRDQAVRFLARYARGPLAVNAFASSRKKRLPTASYATRFNDKGTFTRDELGHVDVAYTWQPAEGLEVFSSLAYDQFHYTGDYVYDYPPVTINRDDTRVHTLTTEQRLGWRMGRHELMLGFELREDVDFVSVNFDVEPYAGYVDNRGDARTLGVFVQDRFVPGRHWELTLGARYDEYVGMGETFNPRGAVVFSPRPRSRIKLLAGRAYRAPNKTELEDAGPWRDNVGVGPETMQAYELAWDEYLSSDLRISSSFFHNIISDQITFGPTSATGEGYFNEAGDTDVTGGELAVDYASAGRWRAQGSASYADVAEENAVVSANSPRWMFKLRAATPVLGGRWRVGLQGVHMDERRTVQGGRTEAYQLVNLTLQYLGLRDAGWRFALAVRNLLDADYAHPAPENHRQDRMPQDPRTITFKVTYSR